MFWENSTRRARQTAMGHRTRFISGIIPLSLCITGAAFAAEGDQPTSSVQGADTIPEITVTSQKRVEKLSEVPMSVSAVNAAALEEQGIKSVADIARITPGLNLAAPASGLTGDPQITIRGIVATAGAATTGIYIDDTAIQLRPDITSINPFPKIFDLDRVEVLRGPQGVLFGAGAEGGMVRFITPQPSLTTYSGMIRGEGSFTDGGAPSYETGAALGGPIVEDKLGFRVSLWHREDGGYVNHVDPLTLNSIDRNSNQEQSTVARLALKFQPTERLTITPSVYYQQTYNRDSSLSWEQTPQGVPLSPYTSSTAITQPRTDHFTLSSLDIAYEFDDFTVKSITSEFHRNVTMHADNTTYDLSQYLPSANAASGGVFLPSDPNYLTRATYETSQTNWSSELRITSNDTKTDRLNWVVGAFYTHNHQTTVWDDREPLDEVFNYLNSIGSSYDGAGCATTVDCLGVPLINNQSYYQNMFSNETEMTGFASVGYKILPDLKVELGARYAHATFDFYDYQDGPDNGGPSVNTATKKQTPVAPRMTVTYQIDPTTMVYVQAAKGYRIGGGNNSLAGTTCAQTDLPNLGLTDAPPTYNSDSVWSYETGSKARLFNNTVELDASVFLINWKNIQSQVFLPVCGYTFTDNLGEAVSRGFDLAGQWRLGGGWVLSGNAGLTDTRYTTTTYSGSVILSKTGDSLPTPEWQAVASLEYNFQVSDYASFVRAEYDFTGPYYRTGSADVESYDPATRNQGAAHYVTLRAGTTIDDIDIAAFANNVLNSRQSSFQYQDTVYSPAIRNLYQRPLTIGVTSTYNF